MRAGSGLGSSAPSSTGMATSTSGRCSSVRSPSTITRLTARFAKGAYTSADRRRFDTRAAGGVGELIYGSSAYDVGVVYERLSSGGLDMDRWYVSAGARTKTGVLSLSVEGHYGQIEGQDEVSAALGVQYDLARGLSVNLRAQPCRGRGDCRWRELPGHKGDESRSFTQIQLLALSWGLIYASRKNKWRMICWSSAA